ncbi:hypothetical protein LLG95_00565 [bacterium]|nr:hypothetical protein [bacterium]
MIHSRITMALAIFCIASCVSFAADDPIIGSWDGVGFGKDTKAVFNKDHTYKIVFAWSKDDPATGTWSVHESKYSLLNPEGDRTGTFDSQGRLVISVNINPNAKLTFIRPGTKPPVSKSASKPPTGEWRYAYTNKSTVPANCPPPFDAMIFYDKKVKVMNTAAKVTMDCHYKVSGDVITISKPGMDDMEFGFRRAAGDKQMILRMPELENGPMDFEWTYIKPDQFLPNDIKGTYVGKTPEHTVAGVFTQEIQLGREGFFSWTLSDQGRIVYKNNKKVIDYYRLWKAPFGNAITIVKFNEQMSAQSSEILKYEMKNDDLILIPIELLADGKFKVHEADKLILKPKK